MKMKNVKLTMERKGYFRAGRCGESIGGWEHSFQKFCWLVIFTDGFTENPELSKQA